jgi:hypothetical protein
VSSNLTASARQSMTTGRSARFSFLPAETPAKPGHPTNRADAILASRKVSLQRADKC